MKCPYCTYDNTEVVETRLSEELEAVRRRRECTKCKKRFTTYERVENSPIVVIKKDGKKERFDRSKLKSGMLKACEKTIIGVDEIENIVEEVERELRVLDSSEVESKKIGYLVASKLKKLDKVAYIRFASVFRRFVDIEDFKRELHKLI